MSDAPALVATIDRNDFKDALRELLRAQPGLYAELIQLFYREGATYEPRRVFEYLFIKAERPAIGTEYKVVSFRPREPNERFLALETFDAENRGGDGHCKTFAREAETIPKPGGDG